jgi:catalase
MGDSPAESLTTSATVGDDDDTSLVTEIVDTFYKIYGAHPGFRVNHAKGVVVKGSFVATPAASALSRAPLPPIPKAWPSSSICLTDLRSSW